MTAQKKTIKQIKTKGTQRQFSSDVLVLFLISFVVHTILNIWVNKSPKVVIDEGLYTNIARSLAWNGTLAFRAQPVNYPYLLYPFLLVPVYWLNRLLGGDVYRYVQVFNTLLITTSVFPAHRFALAFTKDKTKALTAAILVALMPDMLFGGFEMTECLLWPLALWMIFFCYRFYRDEKWIDGLLTALFAGLMFTAKPGAIAVGAALLVIRLILSIADRRNILKSLASIGILLAIIGIMYGIYRLFYHAGGSILGLYTKQTEEWRIQDLYVAIEATFLMLFLFVFACGGLYGIFPFAHLSEYETSKKRFIVALAVGILAAIAGTAFFVVPYKWTGALGKLPLHLRYFAMYIPAMYIVSVDREYSPSTKKGFAAALIVFLVLSVFPGARAGFIRGKTGVVDSMTLDAFVINSKLNGAVTGWILTVIVAAFSLVFLYNVLKKPSKGKKTESIHTLGTVYLIIFLVFNSLCAHVAADAYIDPTISADALEVNRQIGSKECLGITQRYYDDYHSYWLDSRINVPMQQVTIDQMFIETEENDGVYRVFVPVDQAPNINNHETPDTDTFVLGVTIAEHLELSESTEATVTKHGHFTVVRIEPSERWVDTMMYGLDENALYDGNRGCIRIFSDDRNIDGTVRLHITAYGDGILHIADRTIEPDRQSREYLVVLPYQTTISLMAEGGTVEIVSYTTEKQGT